MCDLVQAISRVHCAICCEQLCYHLVEFAIRLLAILSA